MQDTRDTRYTMLKGGGNIKVESIDEGKFSQIAEEVRIKAVNHIRDEKPEAFSAPAQSRDYLRASVRKIALESGAPDINRIVDAVSNDILGFGPLQRLLDDNEVNELRYYKYNNGEYEKNGRLHRIEDSKLLFLSEEHMRRTAVKIAQSAGRRLDESSPIVDARLPDGSRVSAVLKGVSLHGSTLMVRRFPKFFSLDELVAMGYLNEEAKAFLKMALKNKWNIVVCGPMGSGKTTCANSFTGEVDTDVLTIEDPIETRPLNDRVRQFEPILPNIEDKGGVKLSYIVQTVLLRTRPGLLLFGECRDFNTFFVLTGMNTGTHSITTVHSVNCYDAVMYRLPILASMSSEGQSMGMNYLLGLVASSVDVAVYSGLIKHDDGRIERRVLEISEVVPKWVNDMLLPDVRVIFKGANLVQVAEPKLLKKGEGGRVA
ncbi:Flp pilus assembly complex ATPase component TadA [Pelotomaculum terephthalicicum JT]|uniref:CpaF family protein n=1 Tax=Pelotomaculum TaxID=191373 RepID=UPI0009D33475|nr:MULTISPECIES: ATPase, T2SS/T4P/T4SS family [Pelotomaculum]MCG9969620.1 Flp pilus assembly complex ATPase component TadA [Pelotomaculum terephthalicicum JT]OPX91767.1 MAG: putative conjugal transfer protein [Pelotomaculum sp. PtaB.Bin117]